MTDVRPCPECSLPISKAAPGGLCPRCLLGQGLSETLGGRSGRDWQPLSLEMMQQQFPQLEVLNLLGRGGMGAVYKARQKSLDRLVAVKIIPADAGGDPERTFRFMREAKTLAGLSHPNLVTVYDFGQTNDICFFIMEYVEGQDLRQIIDAGGLDPTRALQMAASVCDGLAHAHDQGITHRDIKPENVLVDTSGRVKLADFGIAKVIDPGAADRVLTHPGGRLGTPLYMAPEQRSGEENVGPLSDVYSLGVVLYEMLAGGLPVGRFRRPSEVADVPRAVDELVFRAMETQSEKRFRAAADFRQAIDESLAMLVCRLGRRTARPGQIAAVLALIVAVLAAFPVSRIIRHKPLPQDVVAFGGNYYKPYFEILDWHAARRKCRRLGGHLATVGDAEENVFLAGISRSHVWLGASDEGQEGEWIWCDGSPFNFTSWEDSEPNNAGGAGQTDGEHFLMMSKYGRWNDLPPLSPIAKGYICEWEGQSYPETRPPTTPEELHRALLRANPDYANEGQFVVRDGKIVEVTLFNAAVSDLSPLRALPLRELRIERTAVRDLAPLEGLPLIYLDISHTAVTDLSPLASMSLSELHMNCIDVKDLRPLKASSLRKIGMLDVPATDLSPLASCGQLESIHFTSGQVDPSPLRDHPSLKSINDRPAPEFWGVAHSPPLHEQSEAKRDNDAKKE